MKLNHISKKRRKIIYTKTYIRKQKWREFVSAIKVISKCAPEYLDKFLRTKIKPDDYLTLCFLYPISDPLQYDSIARRIFNAEEIS